VGKEQIVIDRKVTLDELNSLITHEKNFRVLKNVILSNSDIKEILLKKLLLKLELLRKQDIIGRKIGTKAVTPL